ncbi:MAG: hypothetical protein PHC92_04465 [Syntrophomonadaceae bacterium]|nr:hypothetical protein [Syntrophomonadaceae bacterium]MDD3024868.1 hypothetical protein [Syntrophomonadaceae bacterium]
MIWILVLIYVLIIATEVPSLVKSRMYPELAAFVVVFMIGLYISLAFFYEWPLREPFQALMNPYMDMKM